MRITKETENQLLIEIKPGFFSWILFIWGFLMIFFFIDSLLEVPRNMGDVYGAAFVGIFVFISYFLFTENASFDFNRISLQLVWHRKRLFKTKEGIVSFHNIKSVILQSSMSSDSTPNTRVTLVTDTEQIPLTVYYAGSSDFNREIAEKIRGFLEYTEADLVLDSLNEMIKSGQDIEAIKLLRAEKGLSLTEAKEELEKIKDQIFSNTQY